MESIFADGDLGSYAQVVEAELPEHMQVLGGAALDEALESYAETELTDAELLEIALDDALRARRDGQLGGAALDEVTLWRARRRARRQQLMQVRRELGVRRELA